MPHSLRLDRGAAQTKSAELLTTLQRQYRLVPNIFTNHFTLVARTEVDFPVVDVEQTRAA